jgi:hypothetical protein
MDGVEFKKFSIVITTCFACAPHFNKKKLEQTLFAALVVEATRGALADEGRALATQMGSAARSLSSLNILLRRARDTQNVTHAAATLLARKTHTQYVLRSTHA